MDDKITLELDSETLDALSRQADAHGHSIDEELRDIVRQALPVKSHSDRDPIEWARSIRAMTPKGVQQTDSLSLLREDRDR